MKNIFRSINVYSGLIALPISLISIYMSVHFRNADEVSSEQKVKFHMDIASDYAADFEAKCADLTSARCDYQRTRINESLKKAKQVLNDERSALNPGAYEGFYKYLSFIELSLSLVELKFNQSSNPDAESAGS